MIVIPRTTRRLAAVTAVLVGAALAVVSVPRPADADQSRADQSRTVQPWVATRPACATPASTAAFRCFAQKLVTVPAHTAGAMPESAAAVGHGPGGGLSPADLGKFYAYNPKANVTRTVGVVIWGDDPRVRSDLNTFDAHYHLKRETSTSLRVVSERGTSTLPRNNPDTYGEIALDTQAIRAVCNSCRILLVEADVDTHGQPTGGGLARAEDTAVRLGATVVSNSWGGPESGSGSTLHAAFVHPGVVITAATGDDGWHGWGPAAYGGDPDNSASFPSTSPYVVAVGGTSITPAANGTRKNEVVWNSNGGAATTPPRYASGATGGGCSHSQTAPGWQRHDPNYSAVGCNGKRLGTDISVVGDPATGLSIYNHGWGRYGGTSLSAPIVAAMYALAGGSGGSAFPAASLYVNADTLAKSGSRFDVISGGNSYCGGDSTTTCESAVIRKSVLTDNPNGITAGNVIDCSFPRGGKSVITPPTLSPECNATRGFDGPSGLGAPRGLGLFHDTSPGGTLTLPRSVHRGRSATYRTKLVPNRAARIVAVSWNWGDGSKHSSGIAPKHTYRSTGRYTVTMVARDNLSQLILRQAAVTVR